MCGIWAVLGKIYPKETSEALLKQLSARGPEGARIIEDDMFQIGFTRLAINGLNPEGMQPMCHNSLVWACNGEIYNSEDLAKRWQIESTGSDCSVLGPLFEALGSQTDAKTFFQSLDGVFAMVIIDSKSGIAFIGRDPYGVRPLYVGYYLGLAGPDTQGIRPIERMVFSSELKALS